MKRGCPRVLFFVFCSVVKRFGCVFSFFMVYCIYTKEVGYARERKNENNAVYKNVANTQFGAYL